MSGIIRRAHLVLVAAFGERVADPPAYRRKRVRETPQQRTERVRRARRAARDGR